MIFKNLSIYKITKSLPSSFSDLDSLLGDAQFVPCHKTQMESTGFYPPLGKHSDSFIFQHENFIMICQRTEQKVLPASSIYMKLQEKLEKIESEEKRKVGKKERASIKEEVIFECMPFALSETKLLYAYIDIKNGLIFIDSTSSSRCEGLLNQLRQVLGSLPVLPLYPMHNVAYTITTWLQAFVAPEPLKFSRSCTLKDLCCSSHIVKFNDHSLDSDDVKSNLANGMSAISIALNYGDNISFTLAEGFIIKKIKFSDILLENSSDSEDHDEQFKIDFIVMTSEFHNIVSFLITAFGGIQQDEYTAEQMEITGLFSNFQKALADANVTIKVIDHDAEDPLLEEAIIFIIGSQKAAVSPLQRHLRIGYNRSARLIEKLEQMGIVSAISDHGRTVLYPDQATYLKAVSNG